ncbi:MAG: endonuclease/exonuclease/phosphatase family protein [Selenomonadaceae bacterium]|nr:endonuclease/exonuclease/phosphatase family protein [Selenomonadaceae bacterium]MBR3723715.1 endonuclease/exonuclease/phosphatase family protein [Selenomonadaceae bacterium]
MKIATWNIERLKRKSSSDEILNAIEKINADILVLTESDKRLRPIYKYEFHTPMLSEAPSDYHLPGRYKDYRASDFYAVSENRVSIYTNYPCVNRHQTYDKYTALCVELETPYGNLLVYGTIMGILGNRDDSFLKEVVHQTEDFASLSELGNLCICGDFNCSFADNYYSNETGREAIRDSFRKNNIFLLTKDKTECVDHIAISREFSLNYPSKIKEWNFNKTLSDHRGIMVDVCDGIKKDMLYVCKLPFASSNEFSGFAIGLQIWNPRNDCFGDGMEEIGWHDTVHPHSMVGRISLEKDGAITFVRDNGDKIFFKPCTLADYRKEYYKLAIEGREIADSCKTDRELWNYYKEHFT